MPVRVNVAEQAEQVVAESEHAVHLESHGEQLAPSKNEPSAQPQSVPFKMKPPAHSEHVIAESEHAVHLESHGAH